MFQLLSIEDYDEPVEDEENDSNLFTLISPCDERTLLTGGGVGSEETDNDFSSVIYAERETKFKHSEAADILDNPDVEKVSHFPHSNPKAGLFMCSAMGKIQSTWMTGDLMATRGEITERIK